LDYYRLGDGAHEGWEEPYYGDGVTLIEWPTAADEDEPALVVDILLCRDDYDLPRQVTLSVPAERAEILERLS
jgi:tRNA A37 threonylcarbamoyladenosine biosynthesis protein TsaE